jgi:hypothetical protein
MLLDLRLMGYLCNQILLVNFVGVNAFNRCVCFTIKFVTYVKPLHLISRQNNNWLLQTFLVFILSLLKLDLGKVLIFLGAVRHPAFMVYLKLFILFLCLLLN